MHESGFVYNDLKTDNLMIGMSDKNKCSSLKLIDFGLANRYLDKKQNHISQDKLNYFKGNRIFASVN